MAEDQEPPPIQEDLAGTLGLALHEPAGVKAGGRLGDLSVEEVIPLPGDLEEAVIGPNDFLGLRPEDDHRQGGVDHGVLGGHVHVVGDILDVAQDLLPPGVAAAPEVEEEH